MTKERPIIFNTDMVKAILNGKKTQTRRIIKPQPNKDFMFMPVSTELVGIGSPQKGWVRCPFGTPGDKLWVRETYTTDSKKFYPYQVAYKASNPEYDLYRDEKGQILSPEDNSYYPFRWRPSIHMPREHARIILGIINIKVERLNDITAKDALDEGINWPGNEMFAGINSEHKQKRRFEILWESVYGDGAWDNNPYVWVIEFERLR